LNQQSRSALCAMPSKVRINTDPFFSILNMSSSPRRDSGLGPHKLPIGIVGPEVKERGQKTRRGRIRNLKSPVEGRKSLNEV
jgi:hypothetical protein